MAFRYYKYFLLYLALIIASSCSGLLFYDAYTLNNAYVADETSLLVEAVRGAHARPFTEVIILIYYFVYFVVLPTHILRSYREMAYLFKWLVRAFYVMLCVGFVDLLLNIFDLGYIPKHLVHTEVGYVGPRFHALLGEPRDAVPYLIFGLAVMYLRSTLVPKKKVSRALIVVVLVALLLTQSASGAIGLGIGALGVLIYMSLKSVRKTVFGIIVAGLFFGLMIVSVGYSPRLLLYVEMFSGLWALLNSGDTLPSLAAFQASNFLPLWKMWIDVKEMNIMPVIFGSGLGTASITSNNLSAALLRDPEFGIMNPHAQITRVVFEAGVVGFVIYLRIFLSPIKQFLESMPRNRNLNVVLCGLLLGVSLSHRSTAAFIYLGIVVALLTNTGARRAAERPGVVGPVRV